MKQLEYAIRDMNERELSKVTGRPIPKKGATKKVSSLELRVGGDPYDGGAVMTVYADGEKVKADSQILYGQHGPMLDGKEYKTYDLFVKALSKKYGHAKIKRTEMK